MAEPFLGEMKMMGCNFAPRGFALCDGQLLPINQNQSLFSLLGTTYGGDGRTSFALPEMRGRLPMHVGNSDADTNVKLGQRLGTETVTLTAAQNGAHSHTGKIHAEASAADAANPQGNMLAGSPHYTTPAESANLAMDSGSVAINNAGGGQAHHNDQPWLCVTFIIALTGLFPSRN